MRRTPQLVSRINLGAPLPRGRERTQQLVRRRSGAAGDGVVRVRGGASRHVSSKALTSRTGEHHRQQQQQQQHGRNQKIVSGVAGRRWMSAHESVSEQRGATSVDDLTSGSVDGEVDPNESTSVFAPMTHNADHRTGTTRRHAPNGAPVQMTMLDTTADEITEESETQKQTRVEDALSAPETGDGSGSVAGTDVLGDVQVANQSEVIDTTKARNGNGDGMISPHKLVVRTADDHETEVTVPDTTAEAMAMNKSIQEAARMEVAGREHAASEAPSSTRFPETESQSSAGAAAGSSAPPARNNAVSTSSSEMAVTPNAYSRPVRMPVPLTTADAMAMNKVIRSRFSEDKGRPNPAKRAPRARFPGFKSAGNREGITAEVASKNSSGGGNGAKQSQARGRAAASCTGAPPVGPAGLPLANNDAQIDRMILEHSRHSKWSHIVRIWEDIEKREEEGMEVALGPQAYQDVMSAMIYHPDTQVAAKCVDVFEHMVASGKGIKPTTYNLYMKACSLAKLGTQAVKLMERLDSLPGKRFKPNPHFFYNLLTATCASSLVHETKLYYGLMTDMGFVASTRALQEVTDMYIATGNIVEALLMFEDMLKAGSKPRENLANKLMIAATRSGEVELLSKALDLVQRTGNSVLPLTVQNVLYMACRKKDSDIAIKMWTAAQQWDHQFSDVDYSFTVQAFMADGKDEMALATLVQAYKAGTAVSRKTLTQIAQRLAVSNNRLDSAYYTLVSFTERGEQVPVEAVNTIIVGCATRTALDRCFSTAEALPVVFGLEPNLDTFNAMMHVLGNPKKQDFDTMTIASAMSLLDQMDVGEVKPNQETFLNLVDVVCTSGAFSEALVNEVVDRMTGQYGLDLEQDVVETLASTFDIKGMHSEAQAWVDKVPPKAGVPQMGRFGGSPGPHPYRRVAEQRSRYSGFGSEQFKSMSFAQGQRNDAQNVPPRLSRGTNQFIPRRQGAPTRERTGGSGGRGWEGAAVNEGDRSQIDERAKGERTGDRDGGAGPTVSPWSDKFTQR